MTNVFISNVAGHVPTVNQLENALMHQGYNRVDGLLYALKVSGGVKTVICIGQGMEPGQTHDRLHSMDSALDHAAEPDHKGYIPYTDLNTGAWTLTKNPGLFILNQSASDQAASFRIAGNGAIGGNLGVGLINPNNTIQVANLIEFHPTLENTFLGRDTAGSNTTGSKNVAIGKYSMLYNTIGESNTSIGWWAMVYNISGGWNTAMGKYALRGNTIGYDNAAYGYASQVYNISGNENAGYGYQTLHNNKHGSYNVAFGRNALYYMDPKAGEITAFTNAGGGKVTVTSAGHSTTAGYIWIRGTAHYDGQYLTSNITGDTFDIEHSWQGDDGTGYYIINGESEYNVALGAGSGTGIMRGSWNTFVGAFAGASELSQDPSVTHSTALGYAAVTNLSHLIALGTASENVWIPGSLGVGVTTPTRNVDINGSLRIRTITAQTSYPNILVADNNGNVDYILKSTFLTAEVDTLQSVTDRGASSSNVISIPSAKFTTGATVGYYWRCTNVDGSGAWYAGSAADVYIGTWNAATNTPTLDESPLTPASATAGWWYRCIAGGTVDFGSGNITFAAGDDVYYNGSTWAWRKNYSYTLIPATTSVLGGVIIGTNINVTVDGTISVHAPVTIATGSADTLGLTGQELSLDADLVAIAGLSGTTGLLKKTSANTWALDTTTYTTNTGTVTSVDMEVPTGFEIGGNPITASGTLALTFAHGYSLPTDATQANWDTAYTNRITSLTTSGSSGAATLISHTLNIPNYTIAGLGGQAQLNGSGFVKANGTTISYDNKTYQEQDADLTAIAGLTGHTGLLRKTGENTWALDGNAYDNYVSWTLQPEDNEENGMSITMTSGMFLRIVPGSGMNIVTDTSVSGVAKLTLLSTVGDYWKKTSTVLSPKTGNDRLYVQSNAANQQSIYGVATGSGGTGVCGDGETGVRGQTENGYAGHFYVNSGGIALKLEVYTDQTGAFVNYIGSSRTDASKNISTGLGAGAVQAPKRADNTHMGWILAGMTKDMVNGRDAWRPYYEVETAQQGDF